jgi:2,3-bisphosphoglycerate-independent phosphoglycerate mutase
VPFLIYHPDEIPDKVNEYNEVTVNKGSYGLLKGDEFIKAFLGQHDQ